MTGARERILGRLRAALDVGAPAPERRLAADTRLKARVQDAPIPRIGRLEGRERVDRFVAAAEAVQTTVTRLSARDELPDVLAEALRARNLPASIRCGEDPSLRDLDWGGLEVSHGPGRVDEPATLSRATLGVAETGTLALLSGPDNPVTLTFLGETHFVMLAASDIVAGFEAAFAKLRASGRDPRTVNFVTGPSRTGDIEQKLELGAHGPIALHVLLIDDV